jgi:ribosome assembly protein RRB1
MGEFEDQWEDEFEDDEEAGEVVDAAENEDGEDGEMEVDEQEQRPASPKPYLPGTKLEEGEFLAPDLSTYPLLHSFVPTWPSLSFDILRDNDGEDAEMEVDEQEQRPASPKPYLPGTKLEEGEFLAPDLSTYPLLHSFVPTWPSLSFDILRDNDGEERRGYPVSCALVAGTQAGDPTANEVTVMRWEGLGKTRRDGAS